MGIRDSLTGVSSGVIGLLHTRLELFSLEAAQQKARLLKMVGLAFAALLFLTLALLVFSILVTIYFWPTEHRFLALGLLCLFYAVIGLSLLRVVRNALINDPVPFEATLSELGHDAQILSRSRAAYPAQSGPSHEREY